MIAVIKHPGRDPEQTYIENELRPLQEAVGGHLEHLGVDLCDGSKIGILLDAESKLKDYEPNVFFADDLIFGTVLFVGEDGEEFCDLTESQIELIKTVFEV